MMYPKQKRIRKRKKHKESIMQDKDGRCYLCMKLNGDFRIHPYVHEHHVFGGPDRAKSEAEGLKVYLCPRHHTDGPEAVHRSHKYMRLLQQDAQRAYEQNHTREEFMALMGRNYLEGDGQQEKAASSSKDK